MPLFEGKFAPFRQFQNTCTVNRLLFVAFYFRDSYYRYWFSVFYFLKETRLLTCFCVQMYVRDIFAAFYVWETIVLTNIQIKCSQIKDGLH